MARAALEAAVGGERWVQRGEEDDGLEDDREEKPCVSNLLDKHALIMSPDHCSCFKL
jgi:hypothetical protein